MKFLLISLVVLYIKENHVSGHGRLTKPASRASAWRFGFNTPKDYDDVSTHCGHYKHFDKLTPPWCNICGGGGTVHGKGNAKKFLAPGRFATGTITGEYVSGGKIKLKYFAKANHIGYFLVKLCDQVQSNHRDPPQSCFDKRILKTTDGKNTYPMAANQKWHKWEVVIPADVSCKHCILQVDWKTGNQGRCIDLVDCPGKMQEHFVTCSDIRIKGGVTTPGQKGECPKTHKYAYNKGKWCCNTNKDCNDKPLKMTSDCCQYYAYKECPSKKCENHRSVPPPGRGCLVKDKGKHCSYWKKQGYCQKGKGHLRYMKTNCKKSCNFCDEV